MASQSSFQNLEQVMESIQQGAMVTELGLLRGGCASFMSGLLTLG